MAKILDIASRQKRQGRKILPSRAKSDVNENGVDNATLLIMLHDAKRIKDRNRAEEIEKEFLRRDLIVVNKSIRGEL